MQIRSARNRQPIERAALVVGEIGRRLVVNRTAVQRQHRFAVGQ